MIDPDAHKFQAAMAGSKAKVVVPERGHAVTL
jgi:hypothetical protein